MVRIWAKVMNKDKIVKQYVFEKDGEIDYSEFFSYLREICETLDIDIDYETEEYKTLGGMVFSEMPSIPDDGSLPDVEVKGLKIKVEKIVDLKACN